MDTEQVAAACRALVDAGCGRPPAMPEDEAREIVEAWLERRGPGKETRPTVRQQGAA